MNADLVYAGFVRQRRFLISVSLALAAVNYLDLQLQQINVLGNSVTIVRPGRVVALCWIAWGWAVWRYHQWFHDIEAWFQIKSTYGEEQRRILSLVITRRPIPEAEKAKATEAAITQWRDQFPSRPLPSTPWSRWQTKS